LIVLASVLVLVLPHAAHAYIGPGAGFALAGSFFAALATVFSVIVLLFTWPIRWVIRAIRGGRALARSRVKRVVVLGLDGLDYRLTRKFLDEGRLPHMAALAQQGCFKPLATTVPPISPVAWSSFQTGVNPGKHNVFDFLTPDLRSYQPKLSSVEIRPPRRMIRLGKYQLPLGGAGIRLLRKSVPFWQILGKHGIFSGVIRVPITFPPEKFRGVQLSGMCVPDLRGSQGMFSFFTTRPSGEGEQTGGETHTVVRKGRSIDAELVGPENPFRQDGKTLKRAFSVTISGGDSAELHIDGSRHVLRKGAYSDWIRVAFRPAPGFKVYGLCKFLLVESEPDFKLYVTPIHIDPDKPVMPISHPRVYSTYLSKQQGPYGTLGLAEDTWALNEGALTDESFIQQCLDLDREREAMFFDCLDKIQRGLCVCVFDGTDRLQHTFWRDTDAPPLKPEAQARETVAQTMAGASGNVGGPSLASASGFNGATGQHPDRVLIDLYERMDALVGRTMAQCNDDQTVLMIISDHGFNSFRRGIDLNCWLEAAGYLKVQEGRRGEKHLTSIDWQQTRAFAVGLAGIFLNVKGRQSQGIVRPGAEATALCREIAAKLNALIDPESQQSAVKQVYVASETYRGPYTAAAPDLIVGYQRGYRASWETAIGQVTDAVFHTNHKAWSGDHCIDHTLVPGVLFCNRPVESERPRLMDIGPTVLEMFGVPLPAYMDGIPIGLAKNGAGSRVT
jgi:predicted AlkP superfamily phosphohydrolase/phosphomutase